MVMKTAFHLCKIPIPGPFITFLSTFLGTHSLLAAREPYGPGEKRKQNSYLLFGDSFHYFNSLFFW